jgi:hypothetical protein
VGGVDNVARDAANKALAEVSEVGAELDKTKAGLRAAGST